MPTARTVIETEDGKESFLRIDYDYQPAEPATREYPGCGESLTVNSVDVMFAGDFHPMTQSAQEHIADCLYDACMEHAKAEYEAKQEGDK